MLRRKFDRIFNLYLLVVWAGVEVGILVGGTL